MSKKQVTTTAIAKNEPNTALANVPEYLRGKGQAGLEQVERDDMILPRLAIAQSGSPALKKASKVRIDTLEEGELYNTLTREVYGDKVKLIPVLFFKSYIKFKPKGDDGSVGGILGMTKDKSRIDPKDLEFGPEGQRPVWTEFRNFVCWIQDNKQMVVVSMKSSDTKAAKTWISIMRMAGIPAFGRVYVVTTIPKSSNNYDYFGFEVQPTGDFTPENIFHECELLYSSLIGKDLRIDVEGLAEEDGAGEEKAPF